MEPARQNADFALQNLIHEPMFLIDSPGPTSSQFMLQRLRFSQPRKRFSLNLSDQPDDSKRLRAILLDPPRKILKRRGIKF